MFGFLAIAIGFLCIFYASKIGDFVGEISFAEKYLGPGRTYDFIKYVGLGLIIIGFLWLVGDLDVILRNIFGKILFLPQ